MNPKDIGEEIVTMVHAKRDGDWVNLSGAKEIGNNATLQTDTNCQNSKDIVLKAATRLIKDGVMDNLQDFDSHLDNVSNDWLNLELDKIIENNLTFRA